MEEHGQSDELFKLGYLSQFGDRCLLLVYRTNESLDCCEKEETRGAMNSSKQKVTGG